MKNIICVSTLLLGLNVLFASCEKINNASIDDYPELIVGSWVLEKEDVSWSNNNVVIDFSTIEPGSKCNYIFTNDGELRRQAWRSSQIHVAKILGVDGDWVPVIPPFTDPRGYFVTGNQLILEYSKSRTETFNILKLTNNELGLHFAVEDGIINYDIWAYNFSNSGKLPPYNITLYFSRK